MKKNIKRINMGILTVLLCLTLHMKEKNLHSQTNSDHFAILVKQEGNFSAVSATRTGHFLNYCVKSIRNDASMQEVLEIPEPPTTLSWAAWRWNKAERTKLSIRRIS